MSTERDEDRALLEKAAKGAGFVHARWDDRCNAMVMPVDNLLQWRRSGDWRVWVPLEDGGDAFDLQVRLRLTVAVENYMVRVFPQWEETAIAMVEFTDVPDEEQAARLAITRAAAEIWNRSTATTSSGDGKNPADS